MSSRFIYLFISVVILTTLMIAQPQSISNIRAGQGDWIQSENSIAINPIDNTKLITAWNDFENGVWAKQRFAYSENSATTFYLRNVMTPPSYPLLLATNFTL